MLNLPIKILQTKKITSQTDEVSFDDIDDLVALWDAQEGITSRHLVFMVNARSIEVADSYTLFLRFNGLTTNICNFQRISGVNAAASTAATTGANAFNMPPIPGANNANTFGGPVIVVPHAFNTTNHKAPIALGGSVEFTVEAVVGRWDSTDAITSVQFVTGLGDDFEVGSTFSIGVIDENYLVEEIEDAAADFSPTFDNIPQGEGDLVVIGYCRSDRADTDDWYIHNINNDSVNANYSMQYLKGVNAAISALSQNNRLLGEIIADNANGNEFCPIVVSYNQYTRDNQPNILSFSGFHDTAVPRGRINISSARRHISEPINSIQIQPNTGTDFKAGSLFSLYRVPKRIIERVELTEDTPTITFSNIPQNFEALQLTVYARTDNAAINDSVLVENNNDAVAANYNYQYLRGVAAAVTASRNLADQGWINATGDMEGEGEFGGATILLPSYNRADGHKHFLVMGGLNENYIIIKSCRWLSISPITQIELTPSNGTNFLAGSVFELEGVLKKEGLPPDEGEQWGA